MKSTRTLLFIIFVVGLAAACFVLAVRHNAELANRTVELAVDYDEVQALAAASGKPLETVLRSLKSSGVTSVAITEAIFSDLLSTGAVRCVPWVDGLSYRIISDSRLVESMVRDALDRHNLLAPVSPSRSFRMTQVQVDPTLLGRLPLGFALEDAAFAAVREAGLESIARIYNFPSASSEAIDPVAADLRRRGLETVIFAGDEVLGWRGAVPTAADALSQNGLTFGAIEFGKQKGSDKLEVLLQGKFVRTHSISTAEMANYQPAGAAERFVRAARERNIRILYVRMLVTQGPDALSSNLDYLRSIRDGLARAGLSTGAAREVGNPLPLPLLLILMALAVAVVAVLALDEVFALRSLEAVALAVLFGLLLAGASLAGETGRKAVALAAALAFPVWAVLRSARLSNPDSDLGGTLPPGALRTLTHYISAIALAVAGGLMIAAVLSGRTFMTGANQFAGVKIAHVVPILVAAFAAATGTIGRRLPWNEFEEQVREAARRIWNTPVLLGYAAIALTGLLILLVVVMRSGNEAGVGVSPVELRFRSLLDQFLYVRPRSKEIFIGFPALIAAIWLSLKGRQGWASLFFVAGVLGLVSVVNTFCHIHTPLSVSLLRAFNGAWVGAIFGAVGVWLLMRLGLVGGRLTD